MKTMPSSFRCAARAALAGALFVVALGSARGAEDSLSAWNAAEEAYATQHFAAAVQAYERLAGQGDVHAAEIAGQMLLHGESLYGKAVPRDLGRARALLAQAARGGSAVAALLLAHLADTSPQVEEPYVPGPYGC